jgi:hypothetical protein
MRTGHVSHLTQRSICRTPQLAPSMGRLMDIQKVGVFSGALERHSFELILQWLDGLRQVFEGESE